MDKKGEAFEDISDRFIGRSKPVSELLSLVSRVARSDSTVLITGESGTGKERIARILHDRSSRRKNPFVPVNCGAIPEGLIESELFGHEKGAFTGAMTGRAGRFEVAEGGTLFFDEIGELPLSLQVKLLRVLQEKIYERVGGARPRTANVRILAATHRNLEEMSMNGQFREDLFYRLSVIPIEIPPLRRRPEDISLLVDFFINRWVGESRGEKVVLTREAREALVRYSWPGNVRELENVVERLLVLNGGETVGEQDLPEKILRKPEGGPSPSAASRVGPEDFRPAGGGERVIGKPGPEILGEGGPESSRSLPESLSRIENLLRKDFSLGSFLTDIERTLVVQALEKSGGNRSRAAEILGINRTTLIEKIKRFQIP